MPLMKSRDTILLNRLQRSVTILTWLTIDISATGYIVGSFGPFSTVF